ncbi:MAG: DUF177 domain-containing protein [bacterium]|nr:DUF177 domain-containing protein [bacterium]
MDNLKINISNLKDGKHKFDFNVKAEELSIDEVVIPSDIIVSAELYKTGNQISALVDLNGTFKLQCDRCLDDYDSGFNNRFEIIYKTDFKKDVKTVDDEPEDDIKFISQNTKFIDLKNDVRDYILLSIPMKKAPAEIDGNCSYCKKNTEEMLSIKSKEDVNPVWEKLLQTKTKQEN